MKFTRYYQNAGEGNHIKVNIENNNECVVLFSWFYTTGGYYKSGYIHFKKTSGGSVSTCTYAVIKDNRSDMPVKYGDALYIPLQSYSIFGISVVSYTGTVYPTIEKVSSTTATNNATVI